MRAALVGKTVSPGIFDVVALMGREKSLSRLRRALAYIEKGGDAKDGEPA